MGGLDLVVAESAARARPQSARRTHAIAMDIGESSVWRRPFFPFPPSFFDFFFFFTLPALRAAAAAAVLPPAMRRRLCKVAQSADQIACGFLRDKIAGCECLAETSVRA